LVADHRVAIKRLEDRVVLVAGAANSESRAVRLRKNKFRIYERHRHRHTPRSRIVGAHNRLIFEGMQP